VAAGPGRRAEDLDVSDDRRYPTPPNGTSFDADRDYARVLALLAGLTPEHLQRLKLEDIPAEARRRPVVTHYLTEARP
jgi:hypothetical protein